MALTGSGQTGGVGVGPISGGAIPPVLGGGGGPSSLEQWLDIMRRIGVIQNGDDTANQTTLGGSPIPGVPKSTTGTGASTAQLAPQLLGLLGSLFGAGINSNAIQQAQDMLKGGADKFGSLGQQGFSLASPYLDQAGTANQSTLNGSSPWTSLINNSLLPNVRTLNDMIPGLMSQNFSTESPGIMDALGQLGHNANSGPLQTLLDRAQQNVNNGGQTANTRNMFDQYQSMQSGNTPVMQDMANYGSTFLQNGGMNPILQALAGAGTGTASSGGMTPQLAAALQQVQGMLAGGGGTQATNALTQRGLGLANREALAPMGQILSGALDQAGTRQAQAAETMRANALARGGGPGATVANGVQNQAMADFADQGARGQSEAVLQALKDQQGLQLQQLGQGASMAQSGQSLEAQRLGELLNSVSNLTATSTGRMGVGGNLALGASGNATQNMNLGSNLLDSYNRGSLGAGSLADAILTLEMGNQSQNMSLLNQGVGTQSSMLNDVISQLLSGRVQGAQSGAQQAGTYLNNQSQLGNILANGQSNYQNAANGLNNAGNEYLNFSGGMFHDMGPLLNGTASYAAQSPWGKFVDQLGSSGLISQGLGDIFKPTTKPTTAPNGSYDPNGGLAGG